MLNQPPPTTPFMAQRSCIRLVPLFFLAHEVAHQFCGQAG
jgi:hypothetical protein